RRELARLAARLDLERSSNRLGALSELSDSHPFQRAVLGSIAFDAQLELASISELHLTRLFSGRGPEAALIQGGLSGLCDLMMDKLRAHSGQLRPRERASQITVKRSGIQGVKLFGSDEEIGAGTVIAGVDVAAVQRLLADRNPFEQLFERVGEPQPRF